MKLLIAICSCHKYPDRRQAIRETWLKRLLPWMDYFFFVGNGPPTGEPDVEHLNVPDDYWNLSHKSKAAFQAALKRQFDWLLKLDDDTYLVTDRVLSVFFAPEAEYIGSDRLQPHGYASGGAGYFLTRRLVEHLAQDGTPQLVNEDGWVGERLRLLDVPLYYTPLLRHSDLKMEPLRLLWPNRNNNVVTGHYVPPDKMRELDALF